MKQLKKLIYKIQVYMVAVWCNEKRLTSKHQEQNMHMASKQAASYLCGRKKLEEGYFIPWTKIFESPWRITTFKKELLKKGNCYFSLSIVEK